MSEANKRYIEALEEENTDLRAQLAAERTRAEQAEKEKDDLIAASWRDNEDKDWWKTRAEQAEAALAEVRRRLVCEEYKLHDHGWGKHSDDYTRRATTRILKRIAQGIVPAGEEG